MILFSASVMFSHQALFNFIGPSDLLDRMVQHPSGLAQAKEIWVLGLAEYGCWWRHGLLLFYFCIIIFLMRYRIDLVFSNLLNSLLANRTFMLGCPLKNMWIDFLKKCCIAAIKSTCSWIKKKREFLQIPLLHLLMYQFGEWTFDLDY